ncbi:MAG: hypothetical protein ABI828_04135, partial [Actinomycetota bacterium]
LFGVVGLYAESRGDNATAAALAANAVAAATAEEADIPIGGDVRARIVEGSRSCPVFGASAERDYFPGLLGMAKDIPAMEARFTHGTRQRCKPREGVDDRQRSGR